ncbi:MAG: hypothetical protein QM772_04565 [Ottowia sp.]|uniref:hypothetical protein n=1 Tax=Ottowia sp. TaxID=1898956 RepID=UPI0039E2632C
MAFFEMAAGDLADFVFKRTVEINQRFDLPGDVQKLPTEGKLEEKLEKLLPLTGPISDKVLISETSSNWCAYIPNGINGGDVHSQPDYLAGILRVRSVSIVLNTDVPNKRLGSVQFVFRDGQKASPVQTRHGTQYRYPVRSIAAHKESRWEFHSSGDPLAFEETEKYASRSIKDRLTIDMVERYCASLKIEIFDPDFYSGYGCIVNSYNPPDGQRLENFPARKH